MKTILTAILLMTATWAQATLTLSQSFSGGTILAGNPSGAVFSGLFSQPGGGTPVLNATVELNLSGGYNGDLYSYLVAPNGTVVVLMNQPGSEFGAGGAGMNITLTDATAGNGSIQDAGDGFLTGSYNAAGSLSAFDGSTANGTWKLFFANEGSGDGNTTLNSWSLDLTVVPEPVALSLLVFLVMLAALAGLNWAWRV